MNILLSSFITTELVQKVMHYKNIKLISETAMNTKV